MSVEAAVPCVLKFPRYLTIARNICVRACRILPLRVLYYAS